MLIIAVQMVDLMSNDSTPITSWRCILITRCASTDYCSLSYTFEIGSSSVVVGTETKNIETKQDAMEIENGRVESLFDDLNGSIADNIEVNSNKLLR